MADLNVSFEIYNKEAVKRLQEEDPDILPKYSVSESKDLAYNKKQVNAAVTSAIIQGKSIDGIADDLQNRMESLNRNSAIKTARTAITNAQNAGSLSSMKELAAMGVAVQKEWVATLDDRTRESHRRLDGERRDLDETFSNGLMYPGASGSAKETWNCRCTMVSVLPDVDTSDATRWSRDPVTGRREYVPDQTYEEWIRTKQQTGKLDGRVTTGKYTISESKYETYKLDRDTGILIIENHIGPTTIITECNLFTGEIKYGTGASSVVSKNKQSTILRYLNKYNIDIDMEITLMMEGVPRLEVRNLTSKLTTDEIIDRLGGGDMTGGSCSSLALAYIGNRAGCDVLDFRGNESRGWFSKWPNIKSITKLDGVESVIKEDYNGFKAARNVLKTMQDGKEYYFATGSHAAIVRKNAKGYEYLELQTPTGSGRNGFQKLTNEGLKNRFHCKKSHTSHGYKLSQTAVAIEAESLGSNDEFRNILGYINTEELDQMKGEQGYAK